MKKLSLISVAALMLASCSSDEMSAPAGAGTEQEVSLSFQLPSEVMSRAVEQSGTDSSKGGATNCTGDVTFSVELSYNGKVVFSESADATIPNANASVTFRPTLVIGETYKIVAYAQFDNNTKIELTGATVTEEGGINDETVDSYFHIGEIVAQPQMSATLYRPTGKLRIIADDYETAEAQLGAEITSIKVTYAQQQSTTFNFGGNTPGEWDAYATAEDEVFTAEVKAYDNENDNDDTTVDPKTLMVDYIPAPALQENGEGGIIINIKEVEVTFEGGKTFKKNLSTLDVPIKRNYLTTLKGNFFTEQMELTLQIDDAFEEPEQIVDGDLYALVSALENGGTVTLNKDMELDDAYTIPAGKTTVINLNGHTLASKANDIFFRVNGNLVINGNNDIASTVTTATPQDGDHYTYIVSVNEGGTATINGGSYICGDCTNLQTNGGYLNINGGHFEVAETEYKGDYLLNYIDHWYKEGKTNLISVKGGEFVGFNPAASLSEGKTTPVNFVAAGYVTTEENGVWTVTEGPLAKAFANGGAVTLDADVVLSEPLVAAAGKNVVLNLGGYTIKNQTANAQTDVILVEEGATLTIEGKGTVEAVGGNDGFAVASDGTLIINDGTYKTGFDQNNDQNACIYARGNGKIYINGGEFYSETGDFLINKRDADRATTTIEIAGGKFHNFNPGNNASEGVGTNFLAAGYKSVETSENVWEVSEGTLAEVLANGGAITLAEDVTLNASYTVAEGKSLAINLNGKKINSQVDDMLFRVSGELVLSGDGIIETATGSSDKRYPYIASVKKGGKITVNGGRYITGDVTCFQTEGGQLNINGGRFEVTANPTSWNAPYGSAWILNYQGASYAENPNLISVKGGEFVGFNPAASTTEGTTPVSFVATGYKSTEANGVWTVSKN